MVGSKELIRIARNEIYARHGRIFNDEELRNYFEVGEEFKDIRVALDRNKLFAFSQYANKLYVACCFVGCWK